MTAYLSIATVYMHLDAYQTDGTVCVAVLSFGGCCMIGAELAWGGAFIAMGGASPLRFLYSPNIIRHSDGIRAGVRSSVIAAIYAHRARMQGCDTGADE